MAPRRPERFNRVADLLTRENAPFSPPLGNERKEDCDKPIILLDIMGELSSLYAAADIAFLGKSLRGIGGQNPVEAAARGVATVFGPHMENFRAAAEILVTAKSRCPSTKMNFNSTETIERWINEPEITLHSHLEIRAIEALQSHTGAAQRSVDLTSKERSLMNRTRFQLDRIRSRANPTLWRSLSLPLKAAAFCFRRVGIIRRKGFDKGWIPSVRLPAPTISIGNITLGGSGKTPLARWLLDYLIAQNIRPAVILRGYGNKVSAPRFVTETGEGGEEARLLAGYAPECDGS